MSLPIIEDDRIDPEALYAVPGQLLNDLGLAVKTKLDDMTDIPVEDLPMKIGMISDGGDTILDSGSFSVNANTRPKDFPIFHRLGKVPRMWAVWTKEGIPTDAGSQYIVGAVAFDGGPYFKSGGSGSYAAVIRQLNSASKVFSTTTLDNSSINYYVLPYVDDTQIVGFATNNNTVYYPNIRYHWVAAYWDD